MTSRVKSAAKSRQAVSLLNQIVSERDSLLKDAIQGMERKEKAKLTNKNNDFLKFVSDCLVSRVLLGGLARVHLLRRAERSGSPRCAFARGAGRVFTSCGCNQRATRIHAPFLVVEHVVYRYLAAAFAEKIACLSVFPRRCTSQEL